MYRKHHEIVDLLTNSSVDEDIPEAQCDLIGETEHTVSEHAEEQKKAEARFLLKAKHVYKVSQSSMDSLIGDIGEMMERQVATIQQDVASILTSRGVSLDDDLLKAMSLQPGQPFSGLRS